MKRFLLSVLFTMGIGLGLNAQITSYPYLEDFESGAGGWTGTAPWELATPAGSPITGANSGTMAWITDSDSSLGNNVSASMNSPVFDLSAFAVGTQLKVEYHVSYSLENNYDYGYFESSINNGSSWQTITVMNGSGSSSTYTYEETDISSLAGNSSVQFRFRVTTDGSVFSEGIAFDDFSIALQDSPPTATSFTANNDGPYVNQHYEFTTADFGYNDPDADPLDHVLIEVLPTSGTLFLDADNDQLLDSGEEVSVNDQISKADLDAGNLRYFSNSAVNTSFQFEVNDGGLTSNGDYLATLNVTVYTEADFNLNPTSGCVIPHTVFFTDQSTLPDTWSWNFGDGNTSTAQNPIHSYTTPGEYTVTLIVTDTVRMITDTITKQVRISPPITASTSATDVTTFNGSDGTATATPSGGLPPFTYQWDAATGSQTTQTATGLAPGTYTVDVTDSNGCSAPQQSVTVNNAPDTTAPSITCPADINSNTTQVTYTVPTYTDNGFVTSAPTGTSVLGTYNGHTYYVSDVAELPSVAFAKAYDENSYLTTINDAAENTAIKQMLTDAGIPNALIGYNDLVTEGTFVWQNGSTSTFTAWNANEPNDVNGEDYTEIYANSGWNDIGDTARRYIVEQTGAIELVAGLESGATFPPGSTTVTYRATDAAGNTSSCSFTVTASDPCLQTAPYTESFDTTSLPNCWMQSQTAGDGWKFSTGAGYDVSSIPDHTGNGGNYAWTDFSSTDTNVVLELPRVDVSLLNIPILEFFYESHYSGTLSPFNFLYVEAYDGSMWNILQTYQGNTPFGWEKISIDVSSAVVGGVVQLRFRTESGGSSNDFYNDILIDDVSVREQPTCPDPSNFMLSNITGDSVDVAWTENGPATMWEIAAVPTGTGIPTSGTAISTNPYTIMGLSPATHYDVYLRSNCGPGNLSNWVLGGTFQTACVTLIAPFAENFDLSSTPPCWTEAGTSPWRYSTTAGYAASSAADFNNTGGNYAWIDGSSPNGASQIGELTTPLIDISALTDPYLQFAAFSVNTTDNTYNQWEVDVTDSSGTPVNVYTSPPGTDPSNNTNGWKLFGFDLSQFSGPITVTFRVIENSPGTAFYNDILFDAIEVTEAPVNFDQLAGAPPLTLGAACTGTLFSTNAATLEAGENIPAILSDVNADKSVWFSFTAPASGNALVSLAGTTNYDMGVAVYAEPSTPGDASTLGAPLEARYGFTSTLLGTDLPAFADLSGLTPGSTYYVQVLDGAASGTDFCIGVTEPIIYTYDNGWTGTGSPASNVLPTARMEVLSGTASLNLNNPTSTLPMGNIHVAAGATLDMTNNSGITHFGRMQVDGNVVADQDSGLISAVTGETFSGTGTIELGGLLLFNRFAGTSIGADLRITNALSIQNDMDANGNLTFASSADRTGVFAMRENLGDGNFKDITGNTIVERALPLTNGLTGQAYRMMGTSVNSSGTIFDDWQEGGNSPSGYGTHITGSVGAFGSIDSATGLDQTATGNPSMFGWSNDTSQTWTTVTSTNQAGDVLNPGDAYRIFIRGDRNLDLSVPVQTPTETRLRATGTLQTDNLTRSYDVDGGNWVMIANPYQNALDLQELMDRSSNVVDDLVYYWDPTLGGSSGQGAYVTYTGFDGPGTGSGVPTTSNNDYLQPGQAVFVTASSGADGAGNDLVMEFNVNDTDRSFLVTGAANTVFSMETHSEIMVELWDRNALENGLKLNDATRIRFDGDTAEPMGPAKLFNPGESIAVKSGNDHLALANMAAPSEQTLIGLPIYRLAFEEYVLRLRVSEMHAATAYLEDRLTGERTELVDGWNTIGFTADVGNGRTDIADRFAISFGEKMDVEGPAFAKAVTLYPNPVTNGQLFLQMPRELQAATVTITNMVGQIVSKGNVENNEAGGNLIDVHALPAGIYNVEVSAEGTSLKQKVVVH